jgi:hypothetical protein
MSQLNPVQTRYHIFFRSTLTLRFLLYLGIPGDLLSSNSRLKYCMIRISDFSLACYMPCLCVFQFDSSHNTCWRVQSMKIPVMQYLTDLICLLVDLQFVPYANHSCFSWFSNVRTVVISFANLIVDTHFINLIRQCSAFLYLIR